MITDLKLVIFDVDGTLVDSQGDIIAAMTLAYEAVDEPVPSRAEILGIVGLSLDVAIPTLAPELDSSSHATMIESYRSSYKRLRTEAGSAHSSPLYDGARETLEILQAKPETLLGVASGKSRRGLDRLIEGHGLQGLFVTQQVADFHPSKPHPSMIKTAISEAGVEPEQTVMIGDTSFDMEMAAAAGVRGIGVSWGYHPRDRLDQASVVIDNFAELPSALEAVWSDNR